MAYAYSKPSKMGVDGRKAGKCVSLITGQTVTRATLNTPPKSKKGYNRAAK